jgi:Lar family restriction alleviation protein
MTSTNNEREAVATGVIGSVIKPCPMCEGEAEAFKGSDKVHPYRIVCQTCGTATAYHGSFPACLDAWNKRASLPAPAPAAVQTCDLCAGKCRGHSLTGDPAAWEPEPGSRAYQAQAAGEAVAWMYSDGADKFVTFRRDTHEGMAETPLYAAQQAPATGGDAVERVAKAICEASQYEWRTNEGLTKQAIELLDGGTKPAQLSPPSPTILPTPGAWTSYGKLSRMGLPRSA